MTVVTAVAETRGADVVAPVSEVIRGARVLVVNENESVPSDRRVWAIARSLRDAGARVTVVCPQGDEAERAGGERALSERCEEIEIRRFPLRFATGGPAGYVQEYGNALRRTRALVGRIVHEAPVDAVHVCSPPDLMFLATGPARRRGARLVFDHHDLTPELFLTRFGDRHRALHRVTLAAERLALRTADTVIATNESYRDVAISRAGKAPEDVFVVRNGPDTRRFSPVAADPALKRGRAHLLAYVGVMAAQDGVDYALRALAQMAARRDDWFAVFGGEGEARPELERLAAELGIADRVHFAGWLGDDEILPLLCTADVCLSPEPRSPLNDRSTMVKISEYLAMGRPVVAFDLTESRLTARDAAVYATDNDPGSYARAIEQLLDDPQRRARMGTAGRDRVRDALSWERSEEQLMHAYAHALRPRARGPR